MLYHNMQPVSSAFGQRAEAAVSTLGVSWQYTSRRCSGKNGRQTSSDSLCKCQRIQGEMSRHFEAYHGCKSVHSVAMDHAYDGSTPILCSVRWLEQHILCMVHHPAYATDEQSDNIHCPY